MQKKQNMKKQKLVTIKEYLDLIKKAGVKLTRQALYVRREKGTIEFVIGGDTPEYKIDILMFPPKYFKIQQRGAKKKIKLTNK